MNMLDEASWPARKAAVYALGCALRSSAPSSAPWKKGHGRSVKARINSVGRRRESTSVGPSPTRSRPTGDLVQEGRAVPPDARGAVAAVLAKAPADGRADRPRAVLAAVPHCGAGWRADQVVGVPPAPDAFPATSTAATSCSCATTSPRRSERPRSPPAPPKEPLADLEMLPPKLIERLAAAWAWAGARGCDFIIHVRCSDSAVGVLGRPGSGSG